MPVKVETGSDRKSISRQHRGRQTGCRAPSDLLAHEPGVTVVAAERQVAARSLIGSIVSYEAGYYAYAFNVTYIHLYKRIGNYKKNVLKILIFQFVCRCVSMFLA